MDTMGERAVGVDQKPTGIDRRTLVRVGAASAWAVPVVQLASSAPAMAVSTPPQETLDELKIRRFAINRRKSKVRGLVVVRNASEDRKVVGLTVALTIPRSSGRLSRAPRIRRKSPGWTATGPLGNGPWLYVFATGASLPAGTSRPLAFQLKTTGSKRRTRPVLTTVVASTGTIDFISASASDRLS